VLSLVAIALPWWQRRKAILDVRMEKYVSTDPTKGTRIVITNRGPADAADVAIALRYEGQAAKTHISPLSRLSTPVLYAGEEYHVNLMMAFGDNYPDSVHLSWSDSRRGRQSQMFWPSLREP
jgi:hypothetical protein